MFLVLFIYSFEIIGDYLRGTNFREFFSPYIRGYLFSRMSFYSTFAGTNFREWVVSIANILGKHVDEWRMKQEKKSSSYWYRGVII